MLKNSLLTIAIILSITPLAQAKLKPLGKCESAICADMVNQYVVLANQCKNNSTIKNSPELVSKFDNLRVFEFNNAGGLSSDDALRVTVNQSRSMDACGIQEFNGID